ncbi:MAG: glutamate--tRNA ligase [Pseudomonadota bacterium]
MSSSAPVVTRIAPSPTGIMHIGTARTALFCWLYARARGGKFLLRIEDTDRARSTPEATEAIFDGMRWLGLDWDGDAVSQFDRANRHAEVAHSMLAAGHAYKCFSTQDEIQAFRDQAKAEGRSTLFLSPWRDVPAADHPDAPFAIRLRAPRDGETIIQDAVQGAVKTRNDLLDDMVLLRSDGTPTYMLAVVVDDHDMGITHVIRGDDHLSNAARQAQIYHAMGWDEPVMAHLPLIHGPDGKKLSKRHGALGVMDYAAEGYPAPAMRNYLARLGWSHGDDELFTDAQARHWFDLGGIGRAPARLDLKKLAHISGWHIAHMTGPDLIAAVQEYLRISGAATLSDGDADHLSQALPYLQDRAKTLPELLEKAHFVLTARPILPDEKTAPLLTTVSRGILAELTAQLQNVSWERDALEAVLTVAAEVRGLKFGDLAKPLRAALAGRSATPSVYDMMLVLGREESIARLEDASRP